MDDEPVCNFLSPNSVINGDFFLWAPLGKEVKYSNKTQGEVASYNWVLPGTNEETANTTDAVVTYKKLGHYQFPTLESFDAVGNKASYQAEGEVLVSGKAEITTVNCRKWGTKANGGTYQLGCYPLNGGTAGYMGGTNSAGLAGYGNLFMTSHDNAYITGVNVYFASKPTKYEPDQELMLRIWYPVETEDGEMQLNGLPLEVAILPVSEIRETTPDECPAKGAAIGEFRFAEPLQIYDKPLFFVTVEGFGTDPSKADIRMLTDIEGQDIPEEMATNLLAHNSFVNYGNYGYTLPVNYFGTPLGVSFMICPIVDNRDGDATGISSVDVPSAGKTNVSVNGLNISINNSEGKDFTVFDISGSVVAKSEMGSGHASVTIPVKGAYLVKVTCRNGKSDVCKVLVGR